MAGLEDFFIGAGIGAGKFLLDYGEDQRELEQELEREKRAEERAMRSEDRAEQRAIAAEGRVPANQVAIKKALVSDEELNKQLLAIEEQRQQALNRLSLEHEKNQREAEVKALETGEHPDIAGPQIQASLYNTNPSLAEADRKKAAATSEGSTLGGYRGTARFIEEEDPATVNAVKDLKSASSILGGSGGYLDPGSAKSSYSKMLESWSGRNARTVNDPKEFGTLLPLKDKEPDRVEDNIKMFVPNEKTSPEDVERNITELAKDVGAIIGPFGENRIASIAKQKGEVTEEETIEMFEATAEVSTQSAQLFGMAMQRLNSPEAFELTRRESAGMTDRERTAARRALLSSYESQFSKVFDEFTDHESTNKAAMRQAWSFYKVPLEYAIEHIYSNPTER